MIINFGNMAAGSQPNFTKLPGGSVAQGPYDFYSVMHYARKALSNNGQDTISMQPGFTQFINIIGAVVDRTLSKLDRAGMARGLRESVSRAERGGHEHERQRRGQSAHGNLLCVRSVADGFAGTGFADIDDDYISNPEHRSEF